MPIEITIPRLGWNMDEGVFVGWLKADGDSVKAGEAIFNLESDKSVQEIESLDSGTLRIAPDGPKPGDTVPVGALVGYLLQPGEAAPPLGMAGGDRDSAPGVDAKAPPASPASSVERKLKPGHVISSPRARRKASALGIDLKGLKGSGRGGRICERDVLAASVGEASTPTLSARNSRAVEYELIPLTGTRKAIAERMMQSAHGTAPVTLTTSIEATNLVNLRQQFKVVGQSRGEAANALVGYTDIIVKLAAQALREHPFLNACWHGDQIRLYREIHIGIAVDTDAGLLVPVIRDVPELSLRQVAARGRELIERARNRRLGADDLQGATFTVTNLGAFGIDAFTPILNGGQSAVLGLGRIQRQVVPDGSHFAARDRLTLSLTFDHRVVDGAPAARFLQALSNLLENPSPWLMP